MKSILNNCIKGYVTSIIGVLIICITAYACTFQDMDWIWNGLAGCGFGCVLIFTPDDIPTFIKQILTALINKKTP